MYKFSMLLKLHLQTACRSLGVPDLPETADPQAVQQCASQVVRLCLCCDQLSPIDTYWQVYQSVLPRLSTWWRHHMTSDVASQITDVTYLDIAAK
jgi:hypothetical protein